MRMRYLIAHFSDARELVGALRPNGPAWSIRFSMRGRIEEEAAVIVEIAVPELSRPLLLRGSVEAYLGTRHHLVQVSLAASEGAKRDFILALARGDQSAEKRATIDRRFPIDGIVELAQSGEQEGTLSRIVDISLHGARLLTENLYEPEDEVLVNIPAPGTPMPRIITARVAWTRESESGNEIGVTFRTRDRSGVRRTREIVRRLILSVLERAPKPTSLGLGPK